MGTRNSSTKRQKRSYECPDMAAFVKRTMRAMVRRAEGKDLESITALAEIRAAVDAAMIDACTALRDQGYSWADIARELGTSRQAAQQKYGAKAKAAPVVDAAQATIYDALA